MYFHFIANRMGIGLLGLFILIFAPEQVHAHASEQAFVLLLPTNVYIVSGVLTVVLTIVLLAFLPPSFSHRLLSAKTLYSRGQKEPTSFEFRSTFSLVDSISLMSLIVLIILIWLGFNGSHDPLKNPLPLFIWTLWWIGFVLVQGVFGDLWQYLNPWTGLFRLLQLKRPFNSMLAIPKHTGVWPGLLGLILFMLFALADLAPDAPGRLAVFAGLYWCFVFLGVCVFGERWLCHADCFTILLKRYAQLALFGSKPATSNHPSNTYQPKLFSIGFPAWQALAQPALTISGAVFILVLLGTGSFDGFNETFYWLGLIGINPLEFPGRSAVVLPTVIGLISTNIALIGAYSICVFIGVALANKQQSTAGRVSFYNAFCRLAIAVLPIAFAYHFAHFLTALLVNAQYALAAASDPLDAGMDFLGLGTFYVTTGFMNSHHTVEAIWLTQATAVVFGHVLSVLLAHALALDLFGSARRAIISQAPLAIFMVVYTFIGLWLLAAPRGA